MHTATLQEERAGFAVVCMCLLFAKKGTRLWGRMDNIGKADVHVWG